MNEDIRALASELLGEEDEVFAQNLNAFNVLMMQYQCAMLEVRTKLEVLNAELSVQKERNPFESINSRLKTPRSIIDKLKRYGVEVSIESIEKNLHDVAGVRVICSFIDDIYMLADKLCSQDDVRIVARKDYIQNPKPNGYRSLHLIVEVPIFLLNEKKYMQVEVQFRTIAMNFWASLEHKLKYKKNVKNAENVVKQLKECADAITAVDMKMQKVREETEIE